VKAALTALKAERAADAGAAKPVLYLVGLAGGTDVGGAVSGAARFCRAALRAPPHADVCFGVGHAPAGNAACSAAALAAFCESRGGL
jgi:hypothetical protein